MCCHGLSSSVDANSLESVFSSQICIVEKQQQEVSPVTRRPLEFVLKYNDAEVANTHDDVIQNM